MNITNWGKTSAKALTTAAALAGGTHAYADAVRFENNDEFEWSVCRETVSLDITLPAGAQEGLSGLSSINQLRKCSDCGDEDAISLNVMYSAGLIIRKECEYIGGDPMPKNLSNTVKIQSDPRKKNRWYPDGLISCYYTYCRNQWSFPDVGYLGTRFRADDGFHYGWIKVSLSSKEMPHLAALAWGYETEPDTAIQVIKSKEACTSNESMKLKCKTGKNSSKIIASVKKVTRGLFTTFRLDGDSNSDVKTVVNQNRKAKAKFKDVSPGQHTVEMLQCALSEETSCE